MISRAALAPLRHPRFRLLFAGSLLSGVAQWMQQFTTGWLVVQLAVADGRPERGALYLGFLGLARFFPTLILGLAAGVVADHYDRGKVLIATRAIATVAIGLLAIVTLAGRADVLLAVAFSALLGCALAFDNPSRLALTPAVVGPAEGLAAIGIIRVTLQASIILGPLLGGLLIVPLGTGGLMVVTTCLFALSGLGVNRLSGSMAAGRVGLASAAASVRHGLDHVWQDPTLRGFIAVTVVMSMFANSFPQLLPAVAHDTLSAGAVELSWLVTGAGVGAVVGALLNMTMASWRRPGRVLVIDAFALGLLLVLFGAQRSLVPAIALTAAISCAVLIFLGGGGNIVQLTSPDDMRGRVVGLQSMLAHSATHLGTLVLGTLGSVIGISGAISLAGIIIFAAAAVTVRVPAIRDATAGRTAETPA